MRPAVWWVLVGVGSIVAIVTIGRLPRGAPLQLAGVIFQLLVSLFGVWQWRRMGHAWGPTLSWTIPLALWLEAQVLLVTSSLLATIGYYIGIAFLLAMLLSDRTVDWWYRVILRRPAR